MNELIKLFTVLKFHGNDYAVNMPTRDDYGGDDNEDCKSSPMKEVKKIKMEKDICPFCKNKLKQKEVEYNKDLYGDTIKYVMFCGYCHKMYEVYYKLSYMVKVKQDEMMRTLYHQYIK